MQSSKPTRRAGAILAVLAFLLAAASLGALPASAARDGKPQPPGNPDPAGQLVQVQLLGFNDYHGHLEASTPGTLEVFDANGNQVFEVKNGVRTPVLLPAGGGQYLAAKLNQLRAGKKNTLTVAAGDLIGGSPFLSGLFNDEPSVESLNAMKLDVSSVGNHEFDDGIAELLRMQFGGCHPEDGCYFPDQPFAGADFQWLAANTVNEATGETPLPPYWIKQYENIKVGFIGMTTDETPSLVAQAGILGFDFLDEATTANALVPVLKAQGVEAIVVLLHEGATQTPAPGDINGCVGFTGAVAAINAALDPEIDVMITGHTHQPYNCRLNDSAGQPRIITSAYSFGRVVTEVSLVLDKRTNDVRRDLSSAMNHAVIQSQLTADPAVTAVLAKWSALAGSVGNEPVGTITAAIPRGAALSAENRAIETSAGNLVADAQLWATTANGAQLALMNPGGVRSDLTFASSPAGEGDGVVTYGEAFTFQPFGNLLVTIPMTGAQIKTVLNQQCQPVGSSRPFLHLGVSDGLTYDLSKTLAPVTITGANGVSTTITACTSITVANVKLNGVDIVDTTTYRVTVNNFLADGGDNFVGFRAIAPSQRVGGGEDLAQLVAFFESESPVAPPPTNRVNELN